MTPPTLMRFAGGLHPSPHEPPTFTLRYSPEAFRRWLISDPSRSSRNPDRTVGTSGLPLSTFGLVHKTDQSRSSSGIYKTMGCGRNPIRQGLEVGVPFPVGLSPFRLLTMGFLSQAGHLGSLPLPHPYLSGPAISPQGCIPLTLRPKGSLPACTSNGDFLPLPQCASWRTQIEEPVSCW
jgi:hypothetical protein